MPLSIFITGGTSGIGLALATLYLEKGDTVAVCGRDSAKFECLKQYDKASFYQVDVVDREKCSLAINDFHKKSGLDLVIASAGLSFEKKTQIPDFEISRKIIDVNLNGVLNTFEPAIKIMLKQKKGHLVGISSVAGFCGFPGVSAYSAAKSAVSKLCEGYGVDLADFGIDVTCIAPGFVDTPLTQKNHHRMPFLMEVSKAALLIEKAITKKKNFYTFPWLFTRVLIFLSILPRGIYGKLMSYYQFDYAKSE